MFIDSNAQPTADSNAQPTADKYLFSFFSLPDTLLYACPQPIYNTSLPFFF
jgi:hypothetical protein